MNTASEPHVTGGSLAYRVRRSSRARTVRVVIDHRGVEVVLPHGAPEHHAARVVEERAAAIRRALLRVEAARAAVDARDLGDGGSAPLLGQEVDLRVSRLAPGARPVVRLAGAPGVAALARTRVIDGVCSPLPPAAVLEIAVPRPDDRDQVRAALERWYRSLARRQVGLRLDAVTRRNGAVYRRLAIRGQRSRWASCSAGGTMSFNWRLMLAPGSTLDYVVEHEAAHLEVMDHSPRFWALLDARLPAWRVERDWLRENGESLRL